MQLDLDRAAEMLGVAQDTVLRWIRQGKLPALELNGAPTFDRNALVRWAREHGIELVPEPSHDAHPVRPRLVDAARHGGVHYGLRAATRSAALHAAVAAIDLPPGVSAEELVQLLEEREQLASTGVGFGVAIPHPRQPLAAFQEPAVTTFFLEQPLEYGAIDGLPVRVLFLMLSPEPSVHLQLLAQLSFLLREPSFVPFLLACQSEADLLAEMERRLAAIE